MSARASLSTSKVFQLRITLEGSEPPVWRQVQVPGSTTLAEVHRIVQVAMGWEGYHLHQFEVDGATYGVDDGEGWGPAPKDERRTRLDRVAGKGTRFTYEYDFGDSWMHDLVIEEILDAAPGASHPVCLAGERACPPEDCGGVWGYEQLLEAIADPDHEEHDDMLEWVGEGFDPDRLDLDAINDALGAAPKRASARA